MSPSNGSQLGFVSLYSGAGGLDLGFAQAGFKANFANDIDKFAIKTHKKLKETSDKSWERASINLENCLSIDGDIDSIKHLIPDSPDLIIGGPPCQGFSASGKMDPKDPRSKHVFNFIDIVNSKRPTAFLMENVSSLSTNSRWKNVLDELIEKSSKNYNLTLLNLNAADWGVPQNRKRMFLIGSPKGKSIEKELFTPPKNNICTARDAINSVINSEGIYKDWESTANITLAKNPVLRKSPYAGLLLNGSGRVINLDLPSPTLPASMGGNRTPIIDLNQLNNKSVPWIESYHYSLLHERISPLKIIPPDVRMRRITAREAASIQSFPSGINWQGEKTTVFRQIGNAVPPLLSYEIAKIIKENIFEEKND